MHNERGTIRRDELQDRTTAEGWKVKPTVKIYGYGWVGKAMHTLFPEASIVDPAFPLFEYSDQMKGKPKVADVAFICVPTPLVNGELDCSIVEEVINKAKEDLIILRSTVMPGFCDRFRNKNIVFQPEYLGETVAHPMTDQHARSFLILGGTRQNRQRAIELYQTVYNANVTIRQVTNYEAEIIKLSENRAIAFKVAQCQELYDACSAAGVDYNTIREAVYGDDPRFNLLWTFVYPSERGFNSKCIPKDVFGWKAWAESVGYDPKLTRTMLEVNEVYLKQREVECVQQN